MTVILRVSMGLLLIGVLAWLALAGLDYSGEAQVLSPSERRPAPPPPRPTVTKKPVKVPPVRDSPLIIPQVSWPQFVTIILDERGRLVSSQIKTADFLTENLGDGVILDMVRVPGGEFLMGSSEVGVERFIDEEPQHRVQVSAFYIGRFEVTREQWRQVARLPKAKLDLKEDPSGFKDSWRQPVEQVSWEEAVEFCARLQMKTGKAYRLPTEAEWEYAARAGTTTLFAFGPTITSQVVNYDGNHPYGSSPTGIYRGKTTEGGSLSVANAFGIYDMYGNVWEWCQDVWHSNYSNAPADGSAWGNSGEHAAHVLRGCSCFSYGRDCRSTFRRAGVSSDRSGGLGLRVVMVAITK